MEQKIKTLSAANTEGFFKSSEQPNHTIMDRVIPYYAGIAATKPHRFVSFHELCKFTENPSIGEKTQAACLTPYMADGKTSNSAKDALYHLLVIDIDKGNRPLQEVLNEIRQFQVNYAAFTTSSHMQIDEKHPKAENRSKVVIPFSRPISQSEWVILAEGAARGFGADDAQARGNQVFFAPNITEPNAPYECEWENSKPTFDPKDTQHPFRNFLMSSYEEHEPNQDENAPPSPQRSRKADAAAENIIGKVIEAYDLRRVLSDFGYKKVGAKYLAPSSSSGIPGVVVLQRDGKDVCYSHHSNDPLSDGYSHDVFDVLCLFKFGGDQSKAVAYFAQELDPEGQKERQLEFMGKANPVDQAIRKELDLKNFSLNGTSKQMRKVMIETKYVLGELAVLGQWTVFYAKPNSGKTLLTLWLLIQNIKTGIVTPDEVFYINADDGEEGLIQKVELAEKYGFHMIAPNRNEFKAAEFETYLAKLAEQDTARGKVLILDTLKKFADLMDKTKGTKFGTVAREFVSKGGTIIALAHTNKHRNSEGKVIASGTSDITDDADCTYTLDITGETPNGRRIVTFENTKNRGRVAGRASYEYNANSTADYLTKLHSVKTVSDEDQKAAARLAELRASAEQYADLINRIKDAISRGISLRTELINTVVSESSEPKKVVKSVLDTHQGSELASYQFWRVSRGEKNAMIYTLNPTLSKT